MSHLEASALAQAWPRAQQPVEMPHCLRARGNTRRQGGQLRVWNNTSALLRASLFCGSRGAAGTHRRPQCDQQQAWPSPDSKVDLNLEAEEWLTTPLLTPCTPPPKTKQFGSKELERYLSFRIRLDPEQGACPMISRLEGTLVWGLFYHPL